MLVMLPLTPTAYVPVHPFLNEMQRHPRQSDERVAGRGYSLIEARGRKGHTCSREPAGATRAT
jgi:hypothetical protein